MPRPINELVQELVQDRKGNGPDGATNIDRINYVCHVFDMDSIDLLSDYDFTGVSRCGDIDLVQAAMHLALLKLDLLRRQYDNFLITEDEYACRSSILTLAYQRINWHLDHLSKGVPTPPWPSLH